jgi:hypothetical protein
MAIIHDKHFHVVDQKKMGDSGTKNVRKTATLAAEALGTTLKEALLEMEAVRRLTKIERSPVMEGFRTRAALESSLLVLCVAEAGTTVDIMC